MFQQKGGKLRYLTNDTFLGEAGLYALMNSRNCLYSTHWRLKQANAVSLPWEGQLQ